MVFCSYNSNSSSGSDILTRFNPNSDNIGASNGVSQGPLASSKSLVLDNEKEELVKSHERKEKKEICEAKALAALKNHSEAERRRRERINGHLETLRGLVPCTAKMDKATLLAEVINEVKELKKKAEEATKGLIIPMDADEVIVEPCDDEGGDESMSYKASICCDYRPELLADLRHTLDAFKLQLVSSELATFGDRVKNVFVYTCCKRDTNNVEACQLLASNVHQALSSALDKASSSLEYMPRMPYPSKRRRLCLVETSTCSCNHESCSC